MELTNGNLDVSEYDFCLLNQHDNEEQLKMIQRTSSHDGFKTTNIYTSSTSIAEKSRMKFIKRMQTRRENFPARNLWSEWKTINPFVSFCLLRFYQFSSNNKSFWPFDGVERQQCHCFTSKNVRITHSAGVLRDKIFHFLWENNFLWSFFVLTRCRRPIEFVLVL